MIGRLANEHSSVPPSLVLPTLMARLAQEIPDRTFAMDVNGAVLSYRQIHEESLAWAGVLKHLGAAAGDMVLVMLPNSATALAIWLGVSWSGAVEVPVNTGYKGALLRHVLTDSGARIAIVDDELVHMVAAEARVGACPLQLIVSVGGSPRLESGIEVTTRSARARHADAGHTWAAPAAHDLSCVLYTSGTTGPSKGVLVSWTQLYATATGSMPDGVVSPDDTYYVHGPNFHVGGKCLPYLMALARGTVAIRPMFSMSAFWDDVIRFRATLTGLVGAMAEFIDRSYESAPAGSALRGILMTPVIRDIEAFRSRFRVEVYTCYNMTEVSNPIQSDGWQVPPPGSCGRLRQGWPGYEARIVDENDYEVPSGQVGELVLRAAAPWALNGGYLGAPDKTVEAWKNGWFHTGDAFRQDQDGYFYFVDRMKDAIRRRGENISSFEVESEVMTHAAVAECAAVGVPSEFGEEEIMVFIVPKPGSSFTPAALCEYLAERMARFMIPRYVEVVASLPRTATQRVQKADLRALGVRASTWDRAAWQAQ